MSNVELGMICDVLNGFAFRSNNYVNDGIRVIRIANVQKGEIVDNDPQFYPLSTKKQIEKYILEEDDLLVSLTGNVGRVGMLPKTLLPAALNQRVACLRIRNKNIVDKKYLFNILNSDYFEHQCILSAQGIAQKNMSTEWLKTFNVYLPSLERQRKIAEVLDKASELVEKRKAQLAELDFLAESVFYDMFGDPVTNPKGWKIQLLGNICTKITDGKHGGCTIEDNSGYFFIGAREINSGVVNYSNAPQISQGEFEKDYKRCNAEIGDLVIVNTGATIGKSAILNSSYTTKTLLQKSVALIKTDISKILPVFLQFCYRLNENMYRVHNASAQPNLLLSNMRITEVILPPLPLQQQFAERIEKIEEQKTKVKTALKESENLFQRLMQDMFNPEYHNS